MFSYQPYVVEPMSLADLDEVMEIEQASFSSPWSARAYQFEIAENENSTMLVVKHAPRADRLLLSLLHRARAGRLAVQRRPLLGYAGCWYLVDEMHVCTIAVHPNWRQRGLGELLLLSLLAEGAKRRVFRATLEVRVSNLAAQGLYHKYGFRVISRRRHYYADNNEDAYIMATDPIQTNEFRATLRQRSAELNVRFGAPGKEGVAQYERS